VAVLAELKEQTLILIQKMALLEEPTVVVAAVALPMTEQVLVPLVLWVQFASFGPVVAVNSHQQEQVTNNGTLHPH
jgi:hypothetical protein